MADRNTWLIVGIVTVVVLLLMGGPWALLGLPFLAFGAMGWLFAGVVLLPALLLAAGVLFVGYLAYKARVAREEAPAQELMADEDPAGELTEINDELQQVAEEAAASLERTRETMDEGLRG